MAVIRKKLTPDEVSPPNIRLNDTTDEVEFSPDGGTTWIPVLELDPRHAESARLPPLTGATANCDAAARMVAGFQDALTHFEGSVNAAVWMTGIFAVLLKTPFLPGVLIGLGLTIFGELVNIGAANIAAAFTPAVWDDIQCIISCEIGSNGQMSVEQRDSIMAAIAAAHPGVVYNTLVNLVNLFGEVLLSNAGVTRTETGDCTGCDCTYCFKIDFRVTNGASEGVTISGGQYVAGDGWNGIYGDSQNQNDLWGYWNFGEELALKSVSMVYTKTNGTGASNVNSFHILNPVVNYGTTSVWLDSTNGYGTVLTKANVVDILGRGLGWDINVGAISGQTVTLHELAITYRRSAPRWAENC